MADDADRSDPDPALKPDDSGADDPTVPASPRPASPMSWEPVTAGGGGAPAGSGEPGGFSFNLDEAVARIDASGQIPR
ncbi:MAG: hypothetical protein MUE78_03405, partial [Ilumatobacteraceae bacterium]|nr:hypothetical protein [Ilumatobacteraceae bacterium]